MVFYTAVLTSTIITGLSLYFKLCMWIWTVQPVLAVLITFLLILVGLVVYQLTKIIGTNETLN